MINRISCQQAADMMAAGQYQLADIRDPQSFANSHPSTAVPLNNENIDQFLIDSDPDIPTLVICYHGNSSQGAASFLQDKDFTEVYSIDGGFEEWQQVFPDQIASS